jgi:glyoxylase-like metal-dependent hydrolase (beta-lactamase superfamily II)
MIQPPLVESRTVGRCKVHAIQAGGQKLDGGAMFGVVPKPLWERRIAADERNRIQLGMRCLLIEHASGPVLIDSGAGNKESERFMEIYGLENAGAGGRTWLEDGLASLGMSPEDVRVVIQTHLHFDHAGGNTWIDVDGTLRPSFPNARHFVQRGELAFATRTNERTAASYFPRNWEILEQNGRLELLDGDSEIAAGIRTVLTPGHVPYHQSVLVDGGDGEIACFLGDVCPTSAHLPLPWIMGYDVEPLVTLETKRRLLARAAEERWLLVFEHDWEVPWGHVTHDGKRYIVEP